jgi:DNA processing protein
MEAINPLRIRPFRTPERGYAAPDASADADEQARRAVADLLNATPVPVDEIIRQAGLAPAVVQTVLLELELAGRLERHAGGKVSIVP